MFKNYNNYSLENNRNAIDDNQLRTDLAYADTPQRRSNTSDFEWTWL